MSDAKEPTYRIDGRVVSADSRRGVAGLRVEAWDKDLLFDDLVGSATTDAQGRFRIEFSGRHFRELFMDRRPDLFFKVFSGRDRIASTERSVLWNASAGAHPVEIPVPWQDDGIGTADAYSVSGRVTSAGRPGVGGLRVQIVDRNVGEDVPLAEAATDDRGRYQAGFTAASLRERGKDRPDLQARVHAGEVFLAASAVRYDAGAHETLDVELPAGSAAMASEWETLTGALAALYDGRLGDLEESDERQDITYLANKTGWDARAVALAALAEQFSRVHAGENGGTPVDAAFYYALFRAGLPANADTLHHASPQTVENVWRMAIEQGVIPASLAGEVSGAVQAFAGLSARKLLTVPAVAGSSSLTEMLGVSRLEPAQQGRFAELYAAHRGDLPTFWSLVEEAFGDTAAQRLQLDGKLAFLTLNNAPLMRALHDAQDGVSLGGTVDLALGGYHRAERWRPLLDGGVVVPREIPGADAEARKQNYAEYLAAQVRLSHPTASLAEIVGSGGLAVSSPQAVHAFLSTHHDFEIGVVPVQQYVVQNQLDVAEETIAEVKRLQRVYQITPGDAAMAGLLRGGIDAAAQVVRHDRDGFVQAFGAQVGGAGTAAQIYDRSVQVHNAVLNLAISYMTARNGIPLGTRPIQGAQAGTGGSGQILQPAPQGPAGNGAGGAGNGAGAAGAADVIAYGTLEDLFGEMDFCACDHCRSILSPAAYLVDLLHFIDRAPTVAGKQNPQMVLLERRPDLQHLPLTCENTNTALPYIDVVNETLEYFIANGVQALSLNGYAGHDTQGVASEDLMAQPQFVIDAAYDTLRAERFPAPLPFHQPLEKLRRYFGKFEVPLPLAMERLRRDDALERGTRAYGWRDILMEEAGLSRAEHEILTDSAAVPLARMYGFPAAATDASVVAALSNARDFTRRVGITYEEVTAILKTRFVNPNADLIPRVERLGMPFAALAALKNNTLGDAAFDLLLPAGAAAPDPAEYDGDIKAWVRQQQNFDRMMAIITLTDPTASADPCSFATLEFRYARPMAAIGDTSTRLGVPEFVRILRFVRLWKKLGWTIEQTDAVICALLPVPPFGGTAVDTVAKLDAGFRTLLPRLGVALRVMRALNLTPKRDLLPLLALWSSLGDAGLYRQMFLSPALLAQDPAFADDGYGDILQDATQKLVGHAESLRAAFGMTADELSQTLEALGFDTDVVAVPYTHGAATLEQPIRDTDPLLGYDHVAQRLSYTGALTPARRDALKAVVVVSGAFQVHMSAAFQAAVDALFAANQAALTPLTMENLSAVYRRGWLARKLKVSVRELLLLTRLTGLDPFALPDPADPAVLRLVELVQAMKARSLKSATALYLVWNQDLSGRSAPDPAQVDELARALRGEFVAIEDQFAATDDPEGDIARTRMTLVYGTEAADAFFALLDDTVVTDVPYTHAAAALEAAITGVDPKLAYDPFRHRLSHTGLLGIATRNALQAIFGVAPAFQAAVGALFARSEDVRGSFFARFPELEPLYAAYVASAAPPAVRRSALLAAFRPELSRRRKRQQALQRLSVEAQLDLAAAQALLDPPAAPFPLHAAGNAGRPALDDVLALETPGLAAQFFFRNTATGAVDLGVAAAANLDYAATGGNPLPANPTAGDPVSAIWAGRIEAPETGFYNFVFEADAGATVTLTLGGAPRPLTQNGLLWRNTGPLELQAGTLYPVELTVNRVVNAVSVRWETPKRPREVVPPRYLYPPANSPPFAAAYLRLRKAAALAQGLRLTAGELSWFATHEDYQIASDGWLNALPVSGTPTAALTAALLKPFRDLLDFARIKAEFSPDDESLLSALRDPVLAGAADGPLYPLTRWERRSLNDLLAHFGGDLASLGHFDRFVRVYDALALARLMGISAGPLLRATTNEPTAATVRDLDAALRARFDAAEWRTVVQPINDVLRGLQRDALVACILHRMRGDAATRHIDTADKLFEYFLTDVQMEPCMLTSRIRHALSSVQLFIERCLMNLEPRVSPSSIDGRQWEWMKRYRVWEANRKVFLFPENWLEPELRDDKSPFFKEIESELLQGDLTEDAAATALLNYLAKLEEVAMLEPCGIHHLPGDPDRTTDDVDHVVARTSGGTRKYFYRRREYGYWTPWEQIKLDIEDNPVIPVVWKGRLLLLWLRIMKQAPMDAGAIATSSSTTALASASLSAVQSDAKNNAKKNAKVKVSAVLCWSEYYNGKWQPAKTSDVDRPTELGDFDSLTDFSRAGLELTTVEEGDAHHLRISIDGDTYSTFILYNTHSLPGREEDDSHVVAEMFIGPRYLFLRRAPFRIEYYDFAKGTTLKRNVLAKGPPNGAVETTHPLDDVWRAPFFYTDTRHVFYVTTTTEPVLIRNRPDYGVDMSVSVVENLRIPPLVYHVERPPLGPGIWAGGGPVGPGLEVENSDPIIRFMSQDAFINQGIGAVAPVIYGNRSIGPAGALPGPGGKR